MSKPFTDEQNEWLIRNYGCSYKELTEKFNERFGTNYEWTRNGYSPIERRCKRMGLRRTENAYGYTDKENEWIKANAREHSCTWLSRNIESVSGRKHSPESIKYHARENLGIHKGPGCFFEESKTYKRPIGSVGSWGGKARIKINDTGDDKKDWYPYRRYIYEQHHGIKLPKDVQVIALDGDDNNNEISNLCPVRHKENAILAINKWHGKGEITRTAVMYAQLSNALREQEGV